MKFKKGYTPWNKGLTKETDPRLKKLSEALSGKNHPMYGKHHSEESKRKMSLKHSGANNPNYGKTGENHPWYGKHHTTETKRKLSKDKMGSKNPMWKGDEATEYAIRNRLIKAMPVPKGYERHHIDGNGRNSDPTNILVLTRREHMIEDGRMEALIKRNKEVSD